MKICKECNQLLDLSEFGKHPASADGLEYLCKKCKNFLQNKYRKEHPEWTLRKRKEYYAKEVNNPNALLRRIWHAMQNRCNDPENYQYHRYGGRGIKIQWASLDEFRKDMIGQFKEGYAQGKTTIERINNDGNYCKDNCRFATHVEQSNNTRRNVFFDFEGQKQTLAQIARAKNINYKMLWKRVNKRGLSIESAIQEALK